MTLKELIEKHNLKPGDKVRNKHWEASIWLELIAVGNSNAFIREMDGSEEVTSLNNGNYELYIEPKVPLTLYVECEWVESSQTIYPAMPLGRLYEKLKPFIGKSTRMVLTEILCDCYKHKEQVCDICQGYDPNGKDKETL